MTINHEINILLSQLCLICLFLKRFPEGKNCLVLCYGFRAPLQLPVLLRKPPTLLHTPSRVSLFQNFVQGRRKGSFIKADVITKALDLSGVSDRTKDVKRQLSGERRTESLLLFSEAQDEHIANPNFSLFKCRRQAPVP